MSSNIFLHRHCFCCIWTSIISHYEILNLFTDIHHYNSFHLVPNSTVHVPSHLLIILNSSIHFNFVYPFLHLYFILAILVLWSYFFWLVMLSWTPVPLLWLSLLWTSDSSAALKNLPPFTIIWLIISQTLSHSTKPSGNPPILTISFPH